MFFEGDQAGPRGRCPVDGAHDAYGFKFVLPHDVPEAPWSQQGWRFCSQCWGMFYEGDQAGAGTHCPVGGAHAASASDFKFVLPHLGFPSNDGVSERRQIFDLVNTARRQQNPPCPVDLVVDLRLDGVAQAHSLDLAEHPGLWEKLSNGWAGHYGSNDSLPAQRIEWAVGSPGTENVTVHFSWGNANPPTPRVAFDWWMSSEEHRKNLLNCGHKATGVGFAIGSGTIPQGYSGAGQPGTFYYFTQVFHA
ncbi:CAP domain-containing protein [Saccharopolyspora shandongensis]|uniref:CAP domain-containing protein n=1 Tax=Saccharopolyspora shandongensis TaxID=418495 RepID=UPI0033DA66FE